MTINKDETFTNYLRAIWWLKEVLRSEWLDSKQLEALQNRRLQVLIKHAYEKVPYYQRLFDRAGVKPKDILTLRDLKKVPITKKADIRGLPIQEITNSDADLTKCLIRITSGSTGIPLTIYKDYNTLNTICCQHIRAFKYSGAHLTDKILAIGPTYYPLNLIPQRRGVGRMNILSPLKEPEELIMGINLYKPDILHCYPSVFKSIIAFIKNEQAKIHRPGIVVSSAEFLDHQTNDDIVEYFGSRPYQFYGSMEMGRIGSECLYRNGIHINTDFVIPEFIPINIGRGLSAYRIVLTNLFSYTAPFIRYDQGDLVQIITDPCPCGRSFPKITILEARDSEVIHLPNGNMISALYLTSIILNLPGVYQFKIIQEAIDRLIIRIAKSEKYSEDTARVALREIDLLLQGVYTVLEIVPEIERDPSGKVKQFESHL